MHVKQASILPNVVELIHEKRTLSLSVNCTASSVAPSYCAFRSCLSRKMVVPKASEGLGLSGAKRVSSNTNSHYH